MAKRRRADAPAACCFRLGHRTGAAVRPRAPRQRRTSWRTDLRRWPGRSATCTASPPCRAPRRRQAAARRRSARRYTQTSARVSAHAAHSRRKRDARRLLGGAPCSRRCRRAQAKNAGQRAQGRARSARQAPRPGQPARAAYARYPRRASTSEERTRGAQAARRRRLATTTAPSRAFSCARRRAHHAVPARRVCQIQHVQVVRGQPSGPNAALQARGVRRAAVRTLPRAQRTRAAAQRRVSARARQSSAAVYC